MPSDLPDWRTDRLLRRARIRHGQVTNHPDECGLCGSVGDFDQHMLDLQRDAHANMPLRSFLQDRVMLAIAGLALILAVPGGIVSFQQMQDGAASPPSSPQLTPHPSESAAPWREELLIGQHGADLDEKPPRAVTSDPTFPNGKLRAEPGIDVRWEGPEYDRLTTVGGSRLAYWGWGRTDKGRPSADQCQQRVSQRGVVSRRVTTGSWICLQTSEGRIAALWIKRAGSPLALPLDSLHDFEVIASIWE